MNIREYDCVQLQGREVFLKKKKNYEEGSKCRPHYKKDVGFGGEMRSGVMMRTMGG